MTDSKRRRRVLIMGAAGRDFHNFNIVFREEAAAEVVAFTATQIPGIAGRCYPPSLAGSLYPDGIPILEETDLQAQCRELDVDEVVFSYSDIAHETVMHAASQALAAGADFRLLGPNTTMVKAVLPVIAVCAVRTGCGKSQTTRHLSHLLRERGLTAAILRHPMPYGDLERQRVQRFASLTDLDMANCSIEEREEYEPHIEEGNIVFAGVDYADIAAAASREADVILWDGGNNDFPMVRPDLQITLVDALRSGQTASHHPGEAVLRMADIIVVNKVNAASPDQVATIIAEIRATAPDKPIIEAASPVILDDPARVDGKRVLVVEDGPTVTHGGMPHGAGLVGASARPGVTIVDPRGVATAEFREIFARYPHIGPVLPAMGYSTAQRRGLKATIEAVDADIVVVGTPIDLARIIEISKPTVRARYAYADAGEPTLGSLLDAFLKERRLKC
ncbi:MAG: cyclic 2,3-diphosphoglycerate synthase [Alphaproteobacteria bacterium]|nr:cyclic 2,3-diphosphoglycerate synthase [Alphaproteobacteria bacterium]